MAEENTFRKIKVGLVGCGRIAEKHLDAIAFHANDLELCAVCDIDENALSRPLCKTIPFYSDLQTLLKSAEVDLVTLCTPSGLHAEQTILATEYKKHVITEKPMALIVEDCQQMIRASETNKVQLFVVYQNRLNATITHLKKAIEQNRFGKIYMVTTQVYWARPQSYYDQAPWRGTRAMDGGALFNQASHYIDLLQWLFGPVQTVQAHLKTMARHIEMEDSATVLIEWGNGAMGTLNVSMLAYPKNLEGSITVLGENGSAKIGGIALNQIEHWQFKDEQPEDKTICENSYATESVYGFGHQHYYGNVIQALRGKEPALVSGYEGMKSIEFLRGIHQANERFHQ